MSEKNSKSIRIQYFRSSIGRSEKQKRIVKGLGFRKLNKIVERVDTPQIRGMVAKIPHLVRIVDGE
jgi:large subunit ribosomal protein L30